MVKTFRFCLWVNAIVLIFRVLIPAKEMAAYHKFLWDWYAKDPNATVYFVKPEPRKYYPLNMPFYDRPNQKQLSWYTNPTYSNDTTALKAGDLMLFTELFAPAPAAPPGFKLERRYAYYPDWLLLNNTNDWQSRTRIWAVYELKSAQ